MRNDLALMMLDTPVDTRVYVPTCLSNPNTNYTSLEAMVLGWGHNQYGGELSDILQELRMTIVQDEDCYMSMNNIYPGEQLCAGGEAGKDSCQGDSGGPLWRNIEVEGQVRATQIGVVSRGKGCAGFNDPAIFGSVKRIYSWIRSIVRKHKSNDNMCT